MVNPLMFQQSFYAVVLPMTKCTHFSISERLRHFLRTTLHFVLPIRVVQLLLMLDIISFALELSSTDVTGKFEDGEMDDLVACQVSRFKKGFLTVCTNFISELVLHFHVAPYYCPVFVHFVANTTRKFAVYAVCLAVKIQGGGTGKGLQTDRTFKAFSQSMMLKIENQ